MQMKNQSRMQTGTIEENGIDKRGVLFMQFNDPVHDWDISPLDLEDHNLTHSEGAVPQPYCTPDMPVKPDKTLIRTKLVCLYEPINNPRTVPETNAGHGEVPNGRLWEKVKQEANSEEQKFSLM